MSVLTFDNIAVTYQTPDGETDAIKNLTFNVDKNEFVALVGPSGCGKTTVLSLAAGLIKPTSGTVYLSGKPVEKPNGEVGYMLQRDYLFEWLTIEENVTLGLSVQKKSNEETRKYARDILDKYGLGDFASYYPSQLSGGMRQRAALTRTLAFKPKMLLLDEPFTAIDFQTRMSVCNDVHRIIKSEKVTALLVTHDISEAVSMADRIIVLTKRPATVKRIFDVDIDAPTPLARREHRGFSTWFDKIWKEVSQ